MQSTRCCFIYLHAANFTLNSCLFLHIIRESLGLRCRKPSEKPNYGNYSTSKFHTNWECLTFQIFAVPSEHLRRVKLDFLGNRKREGELHSVMRSSTLQSHERLSRIWMDCNGNKKFETPKILWQYGAESVTGHHPFAFCFQMVQASHQFFSFVDDERETKIPRIYFSAVVLSARNEADIKAKSNKNNTLTVLWWHIKCKTSGIWVL